MDFGGKVQEALSKMDAVAGLAPRHPALRWHLVGHLQSNKARKAGARFDVVQSIDSPDLIAKVDEAAAAARRQVEVLVQVDLAGETTKYGAREAELAAIFDAARSAAHLRPTGLMLIPPTVAKPEDARPFFRGLQAVRDRLLARGVADSMLAELSMGMSHDFEVAVEEGATIVRVGTAIFGTRPLTIAQSEAGIPPFK